MNICSFFSAYFIVVQKIRSEGCSERPVGDQNALSLVSKPLPQGLSSVWSERWGVTSNCLTNSAAPKASSSVTTKRAGTSNDRQMAIS